MYTTIFVAYKFSGEADLENLASGFGIGTIANIGKMFFFNPELTNTSPINNTSGRFLTSFIPSFGIKLGNHFSISAGPAVTWTYVHNDAKQQEPFFHIYKHTIDEKNSLVIGARAALRFIF